MFKQPAALKILIPTEMASVYGYFSLQAILVFYLMNQMSYSDAEAYSFSGQFIALAYLMPVIGGWVADRYLGNRAAIFFGSILLFVGYTFLYLGQKTFLLGLTFIIVGNGLFKSNIATFIGEFYHRVDTRREAGFTLVYAAVNLGSLLAILSVGTIHQLFGWAACFAVISGVVLLSICLFRFGFYYFHDKGLSPIHRGTTLFLFLKDKAFLFCLVFSLIIIYYSMKLEIIGNSLISFFAILFVLALIKIYIQLEKMPRRHLIALVILFLIAIYYKAMFFETYLVINVFTERLVDRTILGYEIPATLYLSLSSLFTILLGPLFAYYWQRKKRKSSTYFKFILSLLFVGISMQILVIYISCSELLISSLAMVLFRFVFAISELFILPMGLSLVSEFAPKHYCGLLMGGWYITAALGGKLAGLLAKLAYIPTSFHSLSDFKIIYLTAFQHYALLNFTLFGICLMLIPLMHKLLRTE